MGEEFVYDLNELLNNKDKSNKDQGNRDKGNRNKVMEPALAYRYDVGDKTLEDYLALPEGTRVELIDGVFYDMAAPSFMHQRLLLKIAKALDNFVEKNDGECVPLVAPFDVQLFNDDKTCVQPDILVVCDRERLRTNRLSGAPDFVIEIASPGNWRMDAITKRELYKNAGVREYWIVLPEDRKVLVYRFEKKPEPEVVYTFSDKVPVGIWGGRCKVDFAEIYKAVRFLYEKE